MTLIILLPLISALLALYLDMKSDALGVSARQRRVLKTLAVWAFVPALPVAWPLFKVIAWRRRRRAMAEAQRVSDREWNAAEDVTYDRVR